MNFQAQKMVYLTTFGLAGSKNLNCHNLFSTPSCPFEVQERYFAYGTPEMCCPFRCLALTWHQIHDGPQVHPKINGKLWTTFNSKKGYTRGKTSNPKTSINLSEIVACDWKPYEYQNLDMFRGIKMILGGLTCRIPVKLIIEKQTTHHEPIQIHGKTSTTPRTLESHLEIALITLDFFWV